jgi:hypothetical protein
MLSSIPALVVAGVLFLLGPIDGVRAQSPTVNWLYPKITDTLNVTVVDTIVVQWESNYVDPVLRMFCQLNGLSLGPKVRVGQSSGPSRWLSARMLTSLCLQLVMLRSPRPGAIAIFSRAMLHRRQPSPSAATSISKGTATTIMVGASSSTIYLAADRPSRLIDLFLHPRPRPPPRPPPPHYPQPPHHPPPPRHRPPL